MTVWMDEWMKITFKNSIKKTFHHIPHSLCALYNLNVWHVCHSSPALIWAPIKSIGWQWRSNYTREKIRAPQLGPQPAVLFGSWLPAASDAYRLTREEQQASPSEQCSLVAQITQAEGSWHVSMAISLAFQAHVPLSWIPKTNGWWDRVGYKHNYWTSPSTSYTVVINKSTRS